jgi:release factor glutamine methyltransferase
MKKDTLPISKLIKEYKRQLRQVYGKEESESLLFILLQEFTGLTRTALLAEPERPVEEDVVIRMDEAVDRLSDHVPVQYILGKTLFYGLEFYVDENVLIPRPETEELVDWVIGDLKASGGTMGDDHPRELLDIGTGSGCIAVAIGKNIPDIGITATDIYTSVLQIARKNARYHGLRIRFLKHDILSWFVRDLSGSYDVVVSNPPYICLSERVFMRQNVLQYEPWISLFVSDEHPLIFYEAIAAFANKHLKRPGRLYLEINETKGHEVTALLAGKGFSDIVLRQDINGKDRMVRATLT